MSSQYDSISITGTDQNAVVTCFCGQSSHGVLRITRSLTYDNPRNKQLKEEVDFSFSAVPYAYKFWDRVRNALRAYQGLPIETDLTITQEDAAILAKWLTDRPPTTTTPAQEPDPS